MKELAPAEMGSFVLAHTVARGEAVVLLTGISNWYV